MTATMASVRFRVVGSTLGLILCVLARMAAAQVSQPAEDIQVARWDILLNDNGMDPFDQLNHKGVETTSKGYRAGIYNASELRAAVITTKGLGGLEGGNQNVCVSQNNGGGPQRFMNRGFYFSYYGGPNPKTGIQGNSDGNETVEATADGSHAHLHIDYQQMQLQLWERDANRRQQMTQQKDPLSINYDGQLAPGEAIGFIAQLKGTGGSFYHLVVWESFKSQQRYMQFFQNINSPEIWCQMGPEQIKQDADVSFVWGSKAKHDASQVAPKWEQKLEDGKTLKLTGITRSDKYLFCWWDADGQPIVSPGSVWLGNNSQLTIFYTVAIHGTHDEFGLQTPTGHPGENNARPPETGDYDSMNSFSTFNGNNGTIKVGVAVGPWQQAGELRKTGGNITIDGVPYRLSNVNKEGDNDFYCQFFPSGRGAGRADNPSVVALSAVLTDGTEVDQNWLQQVFGEGYGFGGPNFHADLAKVKSFHAWKRKLQWVSFTDFAAEPTQPPPENVTAEELRAAVGVHEEQEQKQRVEDVRKQLEAVKAERAKWEAIPADPSTARGALRAMFKSAAAGDLDAVRKRIKAKQSDAGPTLDLIARFITVGQSAWANAAARFGEADITVINGNPAAPNPGLMNFELQLYNNNNQPWTDQPDGGIKGQELAVVKGDDGQYYVDFTQTVEQSKSTPQMTQMLVPMADRMEAINKLLKDNPNITLAEFHDALSSSQLAGGVAATRATAATSQP